MADPSAGLPRLTILSGPMSGKELVLEEVVDNILIGADSSCRFHLPLPGISPIHARIWMDAAGVTVYDTHSPRGLYVNDDRVNGQAPLRNGDVLWLGTPGEDEAVMIQCRLPPRESQPAEPAPAVAAASSPPEATEEELTGETVVLKAQPEAAEPEPEVLEVVEEPEAEEAGADATIVMGPAEEEPVFEEAVIEESAADATMVMGPAEEPEAVETPDSDATVVGMAPLPSIDDEPVKFAVDLPPIPIAPPPEAAFFEDETQEAAAEAEPAAAAEATMIMPEPTQALPAVELPSPVAAEAPSPAPPPTPEAVRPAPPVTPVRPAPPGEAQPARAPRPAPRPAAAQPPPAIQRGSAPSAMGRYATLGAVGLLILGGGGIAAWRFLTPSSPATNQPATTPTTIAGAPAVVPETLPPAEATLAPAAPAEPPVEEAVTIVKSPPPAPPPGASPTPTARPTTPPAGAKKGTAAATPAPVAPEVIRVQQAAAQVASLLGQADAALAARSFDSAAGLFDEVLKLDPQNTKAAEGKVGAQVALVSLKKSFVAGKTSIVSGKAAKGGMAGFDTEDVSLSKAPDYSGRIEFEANPKNVKPGDSYTVLVYLMNDGKKSFKLNSVGATTSSNGSKSGGLVPPKAKSLDPQQRALLAEMPGVWQAGTNAWSLEVVVTSDHNDTFKNTLTWK